VRRFIPGQFVPGFSFLGILTTYTAFCSWILFLDFVLGYCAYYLRATLFLGVCFWAFCSWILVLGSSFLAWSASVRPTPACTGCGLQVISYWLGSRGEMFESVSGRGSMRGGRGGGFEDIL
jgi:hypothetical protein